MAEAEKIPKIDPAEVEILIERGKQNKLEEPQAELIAGPLRSLLYFVAMLQDRKASIIRLREMIFGRRSEKRKKADSEKDEDEEKTNEARPRTESRFGISGRKEGLLPSSGVNLRQSLPCPELHRQGLSGLETARLHSVYGPARH